jgi:hypothetical protein
VIGFASPAWLLGLLLAPVIWYVHRSGPLLRRVPVSNLDLWRDAAASAATAGQRKQADPAWRRRAAIAVLLSLALAGPQWTRQAPRVTVWIDDSLSMRATDAMGTRLERGLAQAQRALRDVAASDVIVRSLGDPSRQFRGLGDATLKAVLEQAVIREPRLPPPEVLDVSRSHWLVTDGADAAVNAWAAAAPIDRVLQVDGSVSNAGITRLSVRPQPVDPGVFAIQVQVLNGGDSREVRTVELRAGARPLGARTIEIDAGVATTLDFAVPATGSRIGAHLMPGDALPDDDTLEVDAAALAPPPVAVDPNCPDSVGRAVRAHPGLRIADEDPAQLHFDCGGLSASDSPAPRVRLANGAPTSIDDTELLWSPAADALRQRIAGRMPTSARGALDPPRAADVVLLTAGAVPLIVVRSGSPRVVECALDLDAAVVVAGPGSPLLLNGLAEIALDAPLLGRIASADRGNDASRVAPLAMVATEKPPLTAGVATRITLLPLLLLVLALLAVDLLRRWRA